MRAILASCLLFIFISIFHAQPAWEAKLDSKVRFYQSTDFGIIVAGTEKNLYALDGQTGSILWRRNTGKINETAVTPVPNTDLILLSRDIGDKSRLEAVDLLSGARIWQSDKVKGDVMQLVVDPESDLIAVVLVKDASGNSGQELKRKPIVHVLQLSTGDELWKRELDGKVEMMPARFGDNLGEIAFTLDNYRAPLLLDGRLFLFYEGSTSYDARTGKEKEREKFKINENGLALTEADPVFDDTHIYISGRGKIRAVNRKTGQVDWKSDDLGNISEMALTPKDTLYGRTILVRTGGQFTRIKDGEIKVKGPFGLAEVKIGDGKTLWRYKGGDKGLTNFILADEETIIVADSNELLALRASGEGRVEWKIKHRIKDPQFLLINERGNAVVGGRDEIAAFDQASLVFREGSMGRNRTAESFSIVKYDPKSQTDNDSAIWRVRHKPPGRGVFRIVAGIALRAAALYFRYGGLATSAFGLARGGLNLAGTINSFRWSGLKARFGSFDLTTLASNSAKNFVTRRIYAYGSIARAPNILNRINGLQIQRPSASLLGRITPSRAEAQDSLLDRLDPTRQAEKLSDYLLRRQRLAELRGNFMYYYTDLDKPFDKKGLVGVNVHTGEDARFILNSDPDRDFIVDEIAGLLYSSDGSRMQAFNILNK